MPTEKCTESQWPSFILESSLMYFSLQSSDHPSLKTFSQDYISLNSKYLNNESFFFVIYYSTRSYYPQRGPTFSSCVGLGLHQRLLLPFKKILTNTKSPKELQEKGNSFSLKKNIFICPVSFAIYGGLSLIRSFQSK